MAIAQRLQVRDSLLAECECGCGCAMQVGGPGWLQRLLVSYQLSWLKSGSVPSLMLGVGRRSSARPWDMIPAVVR